MVLRKTQAGKAAMKYGVILIDPPYDHVTWSDKGQGRSPSQHYDTMSIDEICALPVEKYAADDCALFLWIRWPQIFDAERFIEAWGFKYSGLAWEWIKRNDITGKFAFGTGHGTRKNLEPCLLARRGSPKRLDARCRDFIVSPRREHSRKPDVQYERIERMFRGPYLEMFARQQWPGWDSWGNEVDKFEAASR